MAKVTRLEVSYKEPDTDCSKCGGTGKSPGTGLPHLNIPPLACECTIASVEEVVLTGNEIPRLEVTVV